MAGSTSVDTSVDNSTIYDDPFIGPWYPQLQLDSRAFRDMPSNAKNEAKVYINDLTKAIQKQDANTAKVALSKLANLYDKQSELAGGSGTEQGRSLKELAKKCRQIRKELTQENIRDVKIERGTITQNNTGKDINSGSTTNQNDTILAIYTNDGTATGKINDVPKFKAEMEASGYTSEEIKSVLTTYYQNQGVALSELDNKVNDALASSAKQTASTAETSKNKEYAA